MVAFLGLRSGPLLNGAAANGRQPFDARHSGSWCRRTRPGIHETGFAASHAPERRPPNRDSGRSLVPRSSAPRSVSSHSRHSTSSRSAPPWLNSNSALPPGGSPGWNSIPTSSSTASGCVQIDVARLAGQHPVEAQRRDQPARGGSARQRLLPVEPVHADHQPLFVLPPDDVGGLHAGVLHMRRDHREIVGIERDQFELFRRRHPKTLP